MLEAFLSFLQDFLASLWWVIIPAFLVMLYIDTRLFYKREKFKSEMKWELLEIIPPREVEQTPKAMEQVFAAVHAMYSFGIPKSKQWQGVIEKWASFEIVGRAGRLEFFIRLPQGMRNTIEAALYAQYPDADIRLIPEEEDYVHQFSPKLPNETYDLFGTDFVLARKDGYPIRTYPYFEELKEERRVDPIASITEIISKLKTSEAIWLQLLIRPTGTDWTDDSKDLIDEVLGKKKKEPDTPFGWMGETVDHTAEFFKNIWVAIFEHPEWADRSKKEENKDKDVKLTEGNKRVIEAIENKASKIGFDSVLRFVYIDLRDQFSPANVSGVMGALRQFNANNLNSLRPNLATMTIGRAPFKKGKIYKKKRRLYSNYIIRNFPQKHMLLCTEELATLFHFPISNVKSPRLERVTSKRGGPPANLPIYE